MKQKKMKYKTIFLVLLIMSSQLFSENFNSKAYYQLISELQIQDDKVGNLSAFTDVLLPIKRIERKEICLKLLNTYTDSNPMVAYSAANCLLYNGYGKLAIPLFARYIYNGNNEKYFHKRIGYDWLHAGNWYKVDPAILENMLDGMDFYAWVEGKIEAEVLMHPTLYGQKALANVIKHKMRTKLTETPLTENEQKSFKNCSHIFVHIDTYTCKINKENGQPEACQQTDKKYPSVLECRG